MKQLPVAARVFIAIVFVLGAVIALASILALAGSAESSIWTAIVSIVVLSVLIAIFDLNQVFLPTEHPETRVEFTVSSAVKIAAVLLLPAPVVLLSTFIGTLLSEWRLKRVWFKLMFNAGAMMVTYLIVIFAFSLLHDPRIGLVSSVQNIMALAVLGLSEVMVNSLIVSTIVALAGRLPVSYVWIENAKPMLLHEWSMLPLGLFFFILWQYAPWTVLLAVIPLVLIQRSFKSVADLHRQTRAALEALARVLDERDEGTAEHSQHVAEHAGLIGRTLGLPMEEVNTLMRAARLHDIGKVGMRDSILFKPGPLSREEREESSRHAELGGELLEKFPLFAKGADYVRHHHERWDGTGYPDHLAGEAIPLGARILTVADSFQAMIEERPYRRPLTQEQAIEQLRKGAGTQFDPKVVDALLRAKGYPPLAPQHEPALLLADSRQTQTV